MDSHDPDADAPARWLPALRDLASSIRRPVRARLADVAAGRLEREAVAGAVRSGAGDVTFGIDTVAEEAVTGWAERVTASLGPVSVMTEDAGWRHFGADTYDHGGPRIGLDPIDGTRNLMHDLRSAWIVVSFAGAGADTPTFDDLSCGLISEIPDTRGRVARELSAVRGEGARVRELDVTGERDEEVRADREIAPRDDVEVAGGYLPFFGYDPRSRPFVQALCAEVVARLAVADPELDVSRVFDDQYISSGGQLALLALGAYVGIVDARGAVGARSGIHTQTAKPYDMAGAALVAQEAGCVVTAPDGAPLSFPIDVTTPVDFAGFHGRAVAERVGTALAQALGGRPAGQDPK